ncbi:hypothetical protein MVEN_02009500 [Mycena venus]|uniref:Presequence translocated-associated motor subunit PAM17 n=1 Tax=Mycena venus TaxID=2733690 RepID=A0A8H6XCC0_9AGAR|nr:hypothetical protein MVEN_02009500 [Mycena venus]
MQNFASPLRRSCKDIPRFFGRKNGLSSASLRFNSTKTAAKAMANRTYDSLRNDWLLWGARFTLVRCKRIRQKPIMGVDPMIFYGGCTVLCMGAGYVLGPSLGSAVWRIMNRRVVAQIDARDREFYNHIARNRVDSALQSATNPIPDYYGEKVGSLKQYRQWLRDQAKYRRKAILPEE